MMTRTSAVGCSSARFERTLLSAPRKSSYYLPSWRAMGSMTRRCTSRRFVQWRNLRCRSGTYGCAQAKNRVVLCLNRQRYDREGNACKERTHAKKH
jgi:hypothetical protein